MEYTWEITGIKKKNTSDLNDVLIQTYWRKTGIDENGNKGSFAGATPFDLSTVDPNNFIPFESLSEEMVLSWIKSIVVNEYEEHVNARIAEQIENQINPITEETNNFPWGTKNSVDETPSA